MTNIVNEKEPDLTKCRVLSRDVVASGKWISLVNLSYLDAFGNQRLWESVKRVKNSEFTGESATVNACDVVPIVIQPDGSRHLLLSKQYRAPADSITIEFPSGLIDAGESCDECAHRELTEETGFTGTILIKAPYPVGYSPAGSASLGQFYIMEIDLSHPANDVPQQHFDPGEYCENVIVPLDTAVEGLAAFQEKGYIVHSNIMMFVLGLRLGQTLGK